MPTRQMALLAMLSILRPAGCQFFVPEGPSFEDRVARPCHLPPGNTSFCVGPDRCPMLGALFGNLRRPVPADVSLIISDSFFCSKNKPEDDLQVCCPYDGIVEPAPEKRPTIRTRGTFFSSFRSQVIVFLMTQRRWLILILIVLSFQKFSKKSADGDRFSSARHHIYCTVAYHGFRQMLNPDGRPSVMCRLQSMRSPATTSDEPATSLPTRTAENNEERILVWLRPGTASSLLS